MTRGEPTDAQYNACALFGARIERTFEVSPTSLDGCDTPYAAQVVLRDKPTAGFNIMLAAPIEEWIEQIKRAHDWAAGHISQRYRIRKP